ncbi:uncharacterized protein PFL1_02494 [Pseudozyma flocculosa PF-1]|uniref:Histidinol-phosphatase n=2 Tax=Pseudozyma flocculosa TaxID=84751 RepID=A0A5C3EXY8_9BASI|nr:uncharacterized protein PFL1_02494 [Pseudozyma flocculosa PF-1]EPQ29821.1 hypothetical protein PFL1_02494 [Pseudozyma flocculosa PF-1]SPO37114.1 related to HIS2 - histidinol-phosphatase [Pseudozyma flocculosa]
MPHSHHSHSGQFCLHAKSSLSDVVERARALGFTHFHLSEHVPRQSTDQLYPEEIEAKVTPDTLRATFESYLIEARRLAATLDGQMQVLVGCETENVTSPDTLDYLVDVLQHTEGGSTSTPATPPGAIGKGRVDFLVGSVHHTHGVPIDFDPETFERALCCSRTGPAEPAQQRQPTGSEADETEAHEALMLSYLDTQLETMQRLRPEVIGHFDLFRLYRPGASVRSKEVWAKIERNVRYAVGYGALFECNAAAFRKGWQTAYPGKEILELILSLDGRLCLSDDSHGVQAVALNYHRLRRYLVDAGVDQIWYLEKATAEDHQLPDSSPPTRFERGTVARKMGSEWSRHPFWQTYDEIRLREEKDAAAAATPAAATTATASG